MRFGVLQFPGSCDERDAVAACARVADAELIWHEDDDFSGVDAVVVPGGFSYGDYLRAGAIARFAPAMEALGRFAEAGGPVLGICNGFQVLCEAGLLPGRAAAKRGACASSAARSSSRSSTPQPARPRSAPRRDRLSIPVKHMSGRWFAPPELVAELEAGDRIVFRYARRPEPERIGRRRRRGLQRARQRRRAHAPSRARRRSADRFGRRARTVRIARAEGGSTEGGSSSSMNAEFAPAPFVVGVGRSGTTLLRLMLDAHPALAIGPETQFVGDLIDLEIGGANTDELVEAIVAARTWADFGLDPAAFAERAAALDLAGVLRAFYGLYAQSREKPRWGEKTPAYMRRMLSIGDLLEEARFVHLIRDGRDVALSRRARGMGADKPMAKTAMLWRRRIERAHSEARRLPGRYLELRYEDLVADPEPQLRRICELIELDFDPAMLRHDEGAEGRLAELGDLDAEGGRRARDAGERARSHSRAKEPASTSRIGAWRTEMESGDRHEFEAVAGSLLRDLGYDVPS